MDEENLAKVAYIIPSESGAIYEIVINKGSEDGLSVGDRYLVFGIGPEVVDPTSGHSLGKLEIVRGRGQVSHLQPRMATLRATSSPPRSERRKITKSTGAAAIFAFPTVTEEIETPDKEFVGVHINDLVRKIKE